MELLLWLMGKFGALFPIALSLILVRERVKSLETDGW